LVLVRSETSARLASQFIASVSAMKTAIMVRSIMGLPQSLHSEAIAVDRETYELRDFERGNHRLCLECARKTAHSGYADERT
jgi:hypothetical protein